MTVSSESGSSIRTDARAACANRSITGAGTLIRYVFVVVCLPLMTTTEPGSDTSFTLRLLSPVRSPTHPNRVGHPSIFSIFSVTSTFLMRVSRKRYLLSTVNLCTRIWMCGGHWITCRSGWSHVTQSLSTSVIVAHTHIKWPLRSGASMNPESRLYPAGTGGEGPRELHSHVITHTCRSRSEEVQ